MKAIVLPLNAAEGTSPSLGRQLATYVSECVRQNSDAEIGGVNYLSQVEEDGVTHSQYVNIADTLLEREWLLRMFDESKCELALDGLLSTSEERINLTVRIHHRDEPEPLWMETWDIPYDDIFEKLRILVAVLVDKMGISAPDIAAKMPFGTEKGHAFCDYLEGSDALAYILAANGAVIRDFTPGPAFDLLFRALETDPTFVHPIEAILNLSMACAKMRRGSFDVVKAALEKLTTIVPKDFRPYFALGEIYEAVGSADNAVAWFEVAAEMAPGQAFILSRIGTALLNAGMPATAERNFREALELEGLDKPSAEHLATVLAQTNRAHEVPDVWKGVIASSPQNGMAHAQLAISLIRLGRASEAEAVFDAALESLEDTLPVKRWYAPFLVNEKKDYDRAMDFYEDCIDHAPNTIPVLIEYAQTLHAADRDFEIPPVLKQVLESNPDPDTRAEVLGWMIELEQPKRAETAESARLKIEEGDFDTAVRELKPLRNWLGDYWKLWALLATALNRLEQYEEAEEAAMRLLRIYPGNEMGYAELMTSFSGRSRFEEAYNVMRNAAQRIPQNLNVRLNLAVAARRAGHVDEARALARRIREIGGPNEELERVLQEIEA